jgi:hypothetical protein
MSVKITPKQMVKRTRRESLNGGEAVARYQASA